MQFSDEDYERIVGHCQKATQINPKNTEAWHIYSTINDEGSIYFSKMFSKEYGAYVNKRKGGASQ